MGVRCFWLEPTPQVRVFLRRYSTGSKCPHTGLGIHDVRVPANVREDLVDDEGVVHGLPAEAFECDPRWPTTCSCGYVFREDDVRQAFTSRLYRRADTGELLALANAPPGAMWDAEWWPDKGPDGRCLMVRCPDGHDWMIDGPANNCTLPDDREHRCWTRTGEPPRITVGKRAPGQRTCAAGAGSIATPGYHGFLRDGVFT